MDKTYKIISCYAIFPMTVSFYKENNELVTLNVDVDYFNQNVFFKDKDQHPEIDFLKLEEQIIKELVPQEIEQPEISEEVFERAKKVRQEDYTQDLMKNMNGVDYDSGQPREF